MKVKLHIRGTITDLDETEICYKDDILNNISFKKVGGRPQLHRYFQETVDTTH